MVTLNCIIVDDDAVTRHLFQQYCANIPELKVVAECENAADARKVLNEQPVDVAFMDINMPPGKTGLELVREIRGTIRVVFVTTDKQYAFEALKQLEADDYLVKPVSYAQFYKAMQAILADFKTPIQAPPPEADMFVKVDGKLVRVRPIDILYIENIADYVRIWVETPNGVNSHTTYSTLLSLEKKLCNEYPTFYKAHRSYIINIKKITEIEDGSVTTVNNVRIPVARQRRKGLMNLIDRLV